MLHRVRQACLEPRQCLHFGLLILVACALVFQCVALQLCAYVTMSRPKKLWLGLHNGCSAPFLLTLQCAMFP